jgi:hypothetical protein
MLPSPPPPCLFLLFRPCLLVLTRASVSLRRNRGITVLLFWFVLLYCYLVLSMCLFPVFSSLSFGFFRVFSSSFSARPSSISGLLFLCSSLSVFVCLLCLCSEEQGEAGVRWLFVLFPCFCLVCLSSHPLCSLLFSSFLSFFSPPSVRLSLAFY